MPEIVVTANFGPRGKKGGVNRGRGSDPLYAAISKQNLDVLVEDLLTGVVDKKIRNQILSRAKGIGKEKGFIRSGQKKGAGLGAFGAPFLLMELGSCFLRSPETRECPDYIPRSARGYD